MPRQRTALTSQEYSRLTIEDRTEEQDYLKMVDEDGNLVDVGDDYPVPVTGALSDVQATLKTNILLHNLLHELQRTNLYLAEMLGDKFDDY